ncbi:hypothetical protein Baya_1532 [Bagarius yarrelli]|uniref:Uncharacterized protein n=1 Tax=Bagarius yarrelli TaxID=175774 RepID=A0A556TLD5_BAGYA|nr:hypothetical protein Baya_1532 [Bagarius yarrelli]
MEGGRGVTDADGVEKVRKGGDGMGWDGMDGEVVLGCWTCSSTTLLGSPMALLTDARVLSRISHAVLMLYARPCWSIIAIRSSKSSKKNTPPKSFFNNTIIKLIYINKLIKGSTSSISQVNAYAV